MKLHLIHHHTWPTEVPPWVVELNRKLGLVLQKVETIMSDFTDLKGVLDGIVSDVASMKSDFESLEQKLAAVPTAGMTPDQQAALDSAVQQARDIKTSIDAIHTAASSASSSSQSDPAA